SPRRKVPCFTVRWCACMTKGPSPIQRPALCCEASEVRSRLITIINREATAHRRHAVLATKRICDIVFCTLYPPLLTLEPTHPHINRKVSTPFSGRRARRGRDPRPPADLHRCH
ncbi:unnamed protein product, partial [Ascophyllum nodosum]